MNHSPKNALSLSILLTAIAPILWGTTYIVTTAFLPEDRPLMSAVIRTVPAGLVLIALTKSYLPAIPWRRLIILGISNIGIFQTMLFVAAYRLPGGIAAVVGSLQPLLIILLAWGVERKAPVGLSMAASIAGAGGMFLLFSSPDVPLDPVGMAAALIGTASMATGTWLSRRWKSDMPLLGFTGWQLLIGGAIILPLAVIWEPPLPRLTLSNWIGYGYLAILGTALAYSLWFNGIAKLPPVAASALGLLSPVTAVSIGWMFLGEALGPREGIGILVILASVVLMQIRRPSEGPGNQRTRNNWPVSACNRVPPAICISYQTNKHI